MLDAGVMCSLHSDKPSYETGMALLDAAVNRYDRSVNEQCDKTQAVTVMEAIRCMTYNGAYATFEENIKGSIEPGKLADLVILSEDILAIDPMDIYNVKVDMTMLDGEILYERN
jgi:predicted amidohydrolase YtcJ